MAKRTYDVVIWGATGFTGKWVAKHLFDHYPQSELRWAIAGRNPEKMEEVRDFIGDQKGSVKGILADSNDEESLLELAQSTRVIITTVGPYAYYGSKLVKACAESGTHCVDLTGEVPWMREMIDAYSASAEASGAKIVHTCGFDSIPSDIGTFYTQNVAQERFGQPLKSLTSTVMKMRGGVSGGTVHSMLNMMKLAMQDKKIRRLLMNPYALNPDPEFKGPDKANQSTAKYAQDLGMWTAPFVMAAVNAPVVRRSNALLNFPWGNDFSYKERMATRKGAMGFTIASSIAAGFATFGMVALTGPGRKLLSMMLPAQGEGPVVDPDNPGFYVIEFHGETANGEKLHTRLEGDGDPGYGSTSKMLAESAVCLALDGADISGGGGFWTPASAMGEPLLKRLQDLGGLTFTTLDE